MNPRLGTGAHLISPHLTAAVVVYPTHAQPHLGIEENKKKKEKEQVNCVHRAYVHARS